MLTPRGVEGVDSKGPGMGWDPLALAQRETGVSFFPCPPLTEVFPGDPPRERNSGVLLDLAPPSVTTKTRVHRQGI